MFRVLKRKEDKFQKLIEQQATHAFEGVSLLGDDQLGDRR
jgi:hypothetical protein